MGNCSCEYNKKYRNINNSQPKFQNQTINQNNYNPIRSELHQSNTSLPIPENGKYKISRKRKSQNRIIKQLKFNTVNSFTSYNSTLSKTKNTTETSDNKLSQRNSNSKNNKFNLNSRLETIKSVEEKNDEYSDTIPSMSNNINSENNSSQYDYNKKFMEAKTKIRK